MASKPERFDKETAIRYMLDGYKVIESATQSKKQYNGEFCIYAESKFRRVEQSKSTEIDTNFMVNRYWEFAPIVLSMVPQELYKTNLKVGRLINLTSPKIIKTGTDKYSKLPWAIVQYKGNDDMKHTIKMTYTRDSGRPMKDVLENYMMEYQQQNIYNEKKTANFVLREFISEETTKQKKRHISKKELPTMEVVRAIIDNHPEVLI